MLIWVATDEVSLLDRVAINVLSRDACWFYNWESVVTKPKWENEMSLEFLLEERAELLAKRKELNKKLKKIQVKIPKVEKRVDRQQAKKIRDYVKRRLNNENVVSPVVITGRI